LFRCCVKDGTSSILSWSTDEQLSREQRSDTAAARVALGDKIYILIKGHARQVQH